MGVTYLFTPFPNDQVYFYITDNDFLMNLQHHDRFLSILFYEIILSDLQFETHFKNIPAVNIVNPLYEICEAINNSSVWYFDDNDLFCLQMLIPYNKLRYIIGWFEMKWKFMEDWCFQLV